MQLAKVIERNGIRKYVLKPSKDGLKKPIPMVFSSADNKAHLVLYGVHSQDWLTIGVIHFTETSNRIVRVLENEFNEGAYGIFDQAEYIDENYPDPNNTKPYEKVAVIIENSEGIINFGKTVDPEFHIDAMKIIVDDPNFMWLDDFNFKYSSQCEFYFKLPTSMCCNVTPCCCAYDDYGKVIDPSDVNEFLARIDNMKFSGYSSYDLDENGKVVPIFYERSREYINQFTNADRVRCNKSCAANYSPQVKTFFSKATFNSDLDNFYNPQYNRLYGRIENIDYVFPNFFVLVPRNVYTVFTGEGGVI